MMRLRDEKGEKSSGFVYRVVQTVDYYCTNVYFSLALLLLDYRDWNLESPQRKCQDSVMTDW